MSENSRSINHKLNELLSKNNISKPKLDVTIASNFCALLRSNILGKDKQEKVNSIVVMAKLLDCVGKDSVNSEFMRNLDYDLFRTLLSIISNNMSTETYKAILKICLITMSGSIVSKELTHVGQYLPVYDSFLDHIEVLDVLAQKLYLEDSKIIYNSIRLIVELINKSCFYDLESIVTIVDYLSKINFFSTVGDLIESDENIILEAIDSLKASYRMIIKRFRETSFDLNKRSHMLLLDSLIHILDESLNENGLPSTQEEYESAGFSSDARSYISDNFCILHALDLKVFLSNPNYSFKKRFHEELMMSNHERTFPIREFIERTSNMWYSVISNSMDYPKIYSSVLSWNKFIFFSMNNCIYLWQKTFSGILNIEDIEKLIDLLRSDMQRVEEELGNSQPVEYANDITSSKTLEKMREEQVKRMLSSGRSIWDHKLISFTNILAGEVEDFVREQRVIQLVKGTWVYTVEFAEALLNSMDVTNINPRYYFIILSPDRKEVFYKAYAEKTTMNPSYADMGNQTINLSSILGFASSSKGQHIGSKDKKNDSRLIVVKGSISYHRISFLGKNNSDILSFYTDTDINKFIWLDGLIMLKNSSDTKGLSAETKKQIEVLQDIRRNTQILGLENVELKDKDISVQEEEKLYDIDELNSITKDFYYST